MRLLLKNGHVVDPASGLDAKRDVLIDDERVAAIEPSIESTGAQVYDASGLVVAPGFSPPICRPAPPAAHTCSPRQQDTAQPAPPSQPAPHAKASPFRS